MSKVNHKVNNIITTDMNLTFHIVLAAATAIGAFGGFPDPPYLLQYYIQYPLTKWFLLAVLIYQGGGGASSNEIKDLGLTIGITFGIFVSLTIMNRMFTKQMLEESLNVEKEL